MQKWLIAVFVFAAAHAENVPFAIIGGGNSQGYGYAGILGPQSTTTPQTVQLLAKTPSIRTVAINKTLCLSADHFALKGNSRIKLRIKTSK